MKKLMIIFAVFTVVFLMAACDTTTTQVKPDNSLLTTSEQMQANANDSDKKEVDASAGEDFKKLDKRTIATIGDYVLTKEKFKVITDYMKQKFDYKLTDEQEKEFIQYVINKKMMAMEARSLGYTEKADTKAKYDWDMDELLSHQYYLDNVEKKSQVSEKDAKSYYDTHVGDFVEIKAQHILIKNKQLADSLYKRIVGGEAFDEIAKKYSEDTTTKEKGGNLGTFTKGVMVQEFEDTAFALADGEVSQPVKSVYGYHIIKVLERKKYSYDDSKDKINKMIKAKKQQQLFESTIAELKNKYKVTVNQDTSK